jgi:ABC-type polysaccharide/polyol phosphate export permease
MVLASAVAALVVLVSGAFYFRRMERTFADVV